ncbi:ExbD/TolR family protein [Flavitalea sp.]|nr:biopolymer transporter ExbD [Flavitalea sp.]
MPKVKVPRKSTSVDMTAMCDVAFLLLSFFILTTSFKPDEALKVTTPKSVQTKPAEMKDVVLVTMDKEGKVYFSIGDDNREEKQKTIDIIDQQKQLGLTAQEKNSFLKTGSFVGVPFSQLKQYLGFNAEQQKTVKQPGIPVTDTLNNEMTVWMQAANSAFQGKKMQLLVKGDANAKYPSFKGVIDAFKKNDLLKFQMITDQENVPLGSELYKKNANRGATQTPAE